MSPNPTTNTIAIVLNGRYKGHLPREVLDLPEPEAAIVLNSRVGKRLEEVITVLKNGSHQITLPGGKTKTYKTAAAARRALEKLAPGEK